jgi:hypothetical protein
VITLELAWFDLFIPARVHEAVLALIPLQSTVTPEKPLEVKNRTRATLIRNRTPPLVALYLAEPAFPRVPAGPVVAIAGPLDFAVAVVPDGRDGVV